MRSLGSRVRNLGRFCGRFSEFSLYENCNSGHFPFKSPTWSHFSYSNMAKSYCSLTTSYSHPISLKFEITCDLWIFSCRCSINCSLKTIRGKKKYLYWERATNKIGDDCFNFICWVKLLRNFLLFSVVLKGFIDI